MTDEAPRRSAPQGAFGEAILVLPFFLLIDQIKIAAIHSCAVAWKLALHPRLRLLFDLLGENVAFRTYQFSVDTTAGNFADALGNAHITLHQCVQIFCLEDQEARAGQCSHVGRTACAPQHGDLADGGSWQTPAGSVGPARRLLRATLCRSGAPIPR